MTGVQTCALPIWFLFAISTAISAVAIANAAFSRRTRGDDRICHGVTSYILIGIAFAMIHQRVAILDPGSYRLPAGDLTHGQWVDYFWLSFSTLTTAGFGDVAPVSSWARLICTLEAVTGVIYPAVFLARLVSAASHDEEAGAAGGGKA